MEKGRKRGRKNMERSNRMYAFTPMPTLLSKIYANIPSWYSESIFLSSLDTKYCL